MKVSQGSSPPKAARRKTEPQRKLPKKPSRVDCLVTLELRISFFFFLFLVRLFVHLTTYSVQKSVGHLEKYGNERTSV